MVMCHPEGVLMNKELPLNQRNPHLKLACDVNASHKNLRVRHANFHDCS